MEKIIDLSEMHGGQAKLAQMTEYLKSAETLAGKGNDIVLTGAAPVWMYLKIAHALHGKARKLEYEAPACGRVLIFDHTP